MMEPVFNNRYREPLSVVVYRDRIYSQISSLSHIKPADNLMNLRNTKTQIFSVSKFSSVAATIELSWKFYFKEKYYFVVSCWEEEKVNIFLNFV